MVHRNSVTKLLPKRRLMFFAVILIVPIIITSAKSDVPSIKAGLQSNPQEPHYNVQTNISTPRGTTYKRGESLPFVVEIRNDDIFPLPFPKINGMRSFKITDENGRPIGENGSLGNHISPWEYADGNLMHGQTISGTFFLERFLFKPPGTLPSVINIHFVLPIQTYAHGNKPVYSNPVTITLEGNPFERLLTSEDLPGQWTDDMDIFYGEGGGFFYRYSAIHIDGRGKLTTIGLNQSSSYSPIKNGRFESAMEPNKLDELVRLLREFKIERLNEFDTDKTGPDMVYTSITIAKGGKVFYGRYGPNALAIDLQRIILNTISDGRYPPAPTPRKRPRRIGK